MEASPFAVFAGSKGQSLAQQICGILHCDLGSVKLDRFSDGEFTVSFDESIRGKSVYLVQSTVPSSDNLMELLLMIDAARRASAYKVIAVVPYFGWARQDRKDKPRVSIAAKLVANMLTAAGVDRVITIDLHAAQIEAFFDIPVDNLYGANRLAGFLTAEGRDMSDCIIASPDVGGSKRASMFVKKIHDLTGQDVPMVICYKNRPKFNEVGKISILGKVKGKHVIIVDDIADTAGTLCLAAKTMLKHGAVDVIAVVTHGIMSRNACERVEQSDLKKIVFTDTIPFDVSRCSKALVVSVADMLAQTILAIQEHRSVSELNIH